MLYLGEPQDRSGSLSRIDDIIFVGWNPLKFPTYGQWESQALEENNRWSCVQEPLADGSVINRVTIGTLGAMAEPLKESLSL